MIVEDEIFKQIMEWGLNGVPYWEIIKRVEEKYKISLNMEMLEKLIKSENR